MPRRRITIKKDSDDKIVIGEIMGGLGNQLFIIFTTIAYSLKHNIDYRIFNIEKKRKSYFDKEIYKNIKINDKKLTYFKRYQEPHYHYKEIPKMNKIILHGYYQSPKYFDLYKTKIIEMLELDIEIKKYENNKYDGFLHFRIGDYKNIECHPVCNIDYYIKCLEKIKEKDKNNLHFVYYFEEENKDEVESKISVLKEKFKGTTFTGIDNQIEDYQQMLSMTSLKYCIIANSSFSWWGAYLNTHPNKEVYLPEKWFEGSLENYNTSELIMKNYIKI